MALPSWKKGKFSSNCFRFFGVFFFTFQRNRRQNLSAKSENGRLAEGLKREKFGEIIK